MAKKPAAKSLPVRSKVGGRLEKIADPRWKRIERVAQTVRSLGERPLTRLNAQRLAKRLGVSWRTVYRYRQRLRVADEATALEGLTRGWKPSASRLTAAQDQAIDEAIKVMRNRAGPLRVVDLVSEVSRRTKQSRHTPRRLFTQMKTAPR